MRLSQDGLRLSATDVASHLACRHLTTLELELLRGERTHPRQYADPHVEVLRERGDAHERAYLDHLRALGLAVEEIPLELPTEAAAERTLDAMRRGVEAIAQAALLHDQWSGRADVLRRVEQPGPLLGAWSYEPVDTKLARETKAETVLQLCAYAELLTAIQGLSPEHAYVVTPASGPASPERYRIAEYAAYFRVVRDSLLAASALPVGTAATYPTPCAHCEVCRWAIECDQRRRADDHLCLVAGMRRGAERELAGAGVTTLAALASWTPAAEWRPAHGAAGTYIQLREQARLQHASIGQRPPLHVLLPDVADAKGRPVGLGRLPEPSPSDLFLDLEGDPFYGEGGLEYLLGLAWAAPDGSPQYRCWWAIDRDEEKPAFEHLLDTITEALQRDPALHIYHFSHYDATALKRLASRHGTREDELDRLLRARRFVDLHQVVRQGVRAGVESYSIKDLESLYDFPRAVDPRQAGRVRAVVEVALERGLGNQVTADERALVEAYNRDDSWSALALRAWLEARRRELEQLRQAAVTRPAPGGEGEAPEELGARLAHLREVAARLLADVPLAREERDGEQQALWLLAHSLEFHRREQKVRWWEFYRLADLDEEERREEPYAIAGLKWEGRTPSQRRNGCPVDCYRFPPQEVDTRVEHAHVTEDRPLGKVVAIDPAEGRVEIKVASAAVDERPTSLFLFDNIGPKPKDDSVLRLGELVAQHGITSVPVSQAARDLLLRQPPRGCVLVNASLRRPAEDVLDAARRLVLELDGGVLPIQGPPGSGKTYTGAQMIVELVREGKKVGVTATSHSVIRKLLKESTAAAGGGVALSCLHKVSELVEGEPTMPSRPKGRGADAPACAPLAAGITQTKENGDVDRVLAARAVGVVGGTAWLWARAELEGQLDVLFIDEAGQMSLADVLAATPAARSVVLLGDPQQLEQPIQGAHPDGCAVSALDHLVKGDEAASEQATISADRGLFIEHTRRMHPSVCRFTSEQFYDGKLVSLPGLEHQALHAPPPFDSSGLYYLSVAHEGRSNRAPEEAGVVTRLIEGWLAAGAAWTDRDGVRRPLRPEDVLVVSPYNAQVALLRELVPDGVRAGTVDKFQGQQAPVVIYSMTTSTPEEAPRGMEFLYSLERLNVATSRAQCASVLVASPRLLAPNCRTPRQVRLANALCRYVEIATRVEIAEREQQQAVLTA